MTALASRSSIHNAQPFSGEGVSLYLTAGDTVQYRRLSLGHRGKVLRQGWSGRNAKTLRVDSQTGVSDDQIDFALDLSGYAAGEYTADVRTFLSDVENLTTNSNTVHFEIDGAAAEVEAIFGTATWLTPDILSGGDVRFRFIWHPATTGVQPDTFRITFTAGPDSPDDATVSAVSGQFDYELTVEGLSDASAYTVELSAELGAVTATLATEDVTADASGPAAPTISIAAT